MIVLKKESCIDSAKFLYVLQVTIDKDYRIAPVCKIFILSPIIHVCTMCNLHMLHIHTYKVWHTTYDIPLHTCVWITCSTHIVLVISVYIDLYWYLPTKDTICFTYLQELCWAVETDKSPQGYIITSVDILCNINEQPKVGETSWLYSYCCLTWPGTLTKHLCVLTALGRLNV